ncbi:MAG: hypothetical protein AAF098_07045, partial [Pseudomonadota bacterium]
MINKIICLEDFSRAYKWVPVLLTLSFLAACSSNPAKNSQQRAELTQRATERWEALIDKDWNRAYTYTSPAYRAVFSEALYRQKFSYQVEWELTSVEFLNYDRDAAVASVAVR